MAKYTAKTFSKILTLIVWTLSAPFIQGQNKLLTGYVVDNETNEYLIGANITTSNKTGTSTDRNGFFSLVLDQTNRYLIVSYVGYKQDTVVISNSMVFPIIIGLENVSQEEIVVMGVKPLAEYFGRENITAEEINRTPTLLGEKDVIKSLALLPGVAPGSEVSSEIFVRGGNGDQNLTLLDGGNIFASNHLFGFISPFNPYAIKSVDLYKGGFPVEYGGRLSSIIDMTVDGGSFTTPSNELTVGLLNSYFKIARPLVKDKLSLAVTGRVAYPLLLFSSLSGDQGGFETDYYLYDGSIKLNYKPNNTSRWSLTMYNNKDYVTTKDETQTQKFKNKINWGNLNMSLNYFKLLNRGFSLKSNLSLSKYNFNARFDNVEDDELKSQVKVANKINEYSYDLQLNHQPFSWLNLKTGVGTKLYQLNPSNRKFISIESNQHITENPEYRAFDMTWYGNAQIKPFSILSLDVGTRLQRFKTFDFNSTVNLQPRFKLNLNLAKDVILNLSYSKMAQPIQRVLSTSTYVPNDIWLPPVNNLKPSVSDQYSVGLATRIKGYEFVAEGYLKYMSDLVQIVPNNFILFPDLSEIEALAIGGKGKAKGIELSVKKKLGKMHGGLAYTLSKSDRTFATINGGKTFPFKFDRRHDLELLLNYEISKKWSVNSTFVYSSGRRITLADKILFYPKSTSEKSIIELTRSINNAKLRPYNRMDIAFNKIFTGRSGNEVKWSFGLYNMYGYRNPLYITASKSVRSNLGTWTYKSATVKQKAISPLRWIPFINYSIKF